MTTGVAAQPSQRWLPVARAAWFVVVALVVGLSLFNIPFQLVHNQTVCSGAACPSDQLSPASLVQLHQAGLSLAFYAGYPIALNTFYMLVFLMVSALIFWRKSSDWFGIFTAIALALTSSTIGGTPPPAMVSHYPDLLFPVHLVSMMANVAFFVFFYLFPDGHFVPHWTVWLVPLVIVHEALSAFRPDLLGNDWYFSVVLLSAVLAQIYRYWRVSNTVQRQRTKWVVFGSIVAGGGLIALGVFVSIVYPSGQPPGVGVLIADTAVTLGVLLIPLSIGIAILRSHLWDIDILIRRTLIYAVLTALLALVYLGAVVALQALFTALTGQQRSEVVTVISTLVIAALFVPLRNRVQALIDRRLYRSKYDAARTLAQFGAALRDDAAADLDDLSAHLLTAVDETMQPAAVSLWLASAAERPVPWNGSGPVPKDDK